ncbi:MAG: 3'-5' exonuclease [Flavobacteriales bacterium]|nr:3'-5' exonuclease [Flavobacteriales bacterium]
MTNNTILFYDTETTDMPNWKIPSDDVTQPHLVQLAAILCDADTKEIIQSIDLIIKPEGWESSKEALETHGITEEFALEHGIPEPYVVGMLELMRGDALRVAYNKTFDQRIIRIAYKRYCKEELIDSWAEKDDHKCAMQMARKAMGGKNPKLIDAYKHFTGKELENAHSAMADTLACMEVYFAIREQHPEI